MSATRSNPWIAHVKSVQAAKHLTYKDALKAASDKGPMDIMTKRTTKIAKRCVTSMGFDMQFAIGIDAPHIPGVDIPTYLHAMCLFPIQNDVITGGNQVLHIPQPGENYESS